MRGISIVLLLLVSGLSLAQQTHIDSSDSYVAFEVSNMMVNNVEGKIYGMWGEVNFDPNDLSHSSMVAQIDPNSVITGNDTRDKHVKGPDYFSSSVYPSIKFKSKSISEVGGHYVATGILTMKGTSKTVEIEFNETVHKEKRALEGTFTLDRYDFSLGSTGGFAIGREVNITIFCVLESQ